MKGIGKESKLYKMIKKYIYLINKVLDVFALVNEMNVKNLHHVELLSQLKIFRIINPSLKPL